MPIPREANDGGVVRPFVRVLRSPPTYPQRRALPGVVPREARRALPGAAEKIFRLASLAQDDTVGATFGRPRIRNNPSVTALA